MKKRTKICVFAALCVLVLSVGLLTGCSNGEDKKDGDVTEPPIENQLPAEPEQNTTEPENPEDSQKEPDGTETPEEGEKEDNADGKELPESGQENESAGEGGTDVEEPETLKTGVEQPEE